MPAEYWRSPARAQAQKAISRQRMALAAGLALDSSRVLGGAAIGESHMSQREPSKNMMELTLLVDGFLC
jgi:hypothetical protein